MPESIDTSLVRIRTVDGGVVGAGFLVGECLVLTCAHVIAQALGLTDTPADPPLAPIVLDFPLLAPHTQLTARVVFWCPVQSDGRGDIAGLKLLDEPPNGAEAIHFASSEQTWQHPYRAFGFPAGQDDGVWSEGRLLGRQGTNWIQLEDDKIPGFAVIAGFSGAPVWDEQLQGVVGMIVASSQPATTKTAFAIPSDVLIASWLQLASLMRPLIPRNPYKGLRAFTEQDAHDFFGRDRLTDELVTAVSTALTREQKEGQHARRLAVVLGPSGSGKSSVVMAGLIPRLRAGAVLNSNEWVYLDPVVPGTDPLEALIITLKSHFPDTSFKTLREDLEGETSNGLYLLATQLVKKKEAKVVLLVDQFEEAFTLLTDEAQRRHFFELLVTAVTEPRSPLFVILTLRADFYDRPMRYPELYRLIDDHHVSVLPMVTEDLCRVIEEPANLPDVQLTFESRLVDELLLEMQGQSPALPLLEFTLDQLVQRRNGHQLTLQAYHEMGGLKGALSQHAEETYQALPSDEHRQMAREVFLRLVSPGATEQDTTRRRAAHSEFERADPVQTQRMQETLETFIRARLLTTTQVSGTTTIEVSHEALLREWKRLATWLREARNDILLQHSLSEDVVEWEQHKHPKDRLYRGVQLKEAQAWARRNRPSEQEAAFLQASAAQRNRLVVSLVAIAFLLASSIGVAGWFALTRPPDPTLVTTPQDNVAGSLRYCIANASSGSTIRFAPGMRGTIKLTGGGLIFAGGMQLTVVGPGADQLTISGGNSNGTIRVAKGATVNLSGLSFKASQTVVGGFLHNEGTLTVTSSTISNNKESASGIGYGGGIDNTSTGTLTVISSTISDNMASGYGEGSYGYGGGIYNEGTLTVINSFIRDNKAISSNGVSVGGGIYNTNTGTLMVINSHLSGNSSQGYGGGIYNAGTLTVTNSFIRDNKAISSSGNDRPNNGRGGGIDNTNTGTLTVSASTFSGNSASGKQIGAGGGIYNEGKLTVTNNSTFSNNSASGSSSNGLGGGIYNQSIGTLMVSASTFSGNSASGKQTSVGGGIGNAGKLTVTTSTFSNNSVSSNSSNGLGGGIHSNSMGTLVVSASTFLGNSASGKQDGVGGGIGNTGKLTVTTSTFSNNSASSSSGNGLGGGIHSSSAGTSSFIRFCTIYKNTSNVGGGIWVSPTGSSHLTISGSIIAANSAHDSPDISGALISDGYNLITNFAGIKGLNPTTDRQVTLADLKINPTLGNNGGPTQTLALLLGSSAIDAVPRQACSITVTDVSGHSVTITTDQRGNRRPDGSENACDIGAYKSSY